MIDFERSPLPYRSLFALFATITIDVRLLTDGEIGKGVCETSVTQSVRPSVITFQRSYYQWNKIRTKQPNNPLRLCILLAMCLRYGLHSFRIGIRIWVLGSFWVLPAYLTLLLISYNGFLLVLAKKIHSV